MSTQLINKEIEELETELRGANLALKSFLGVKYNKTTGEVNSINYHGIQDIDQPINNILIYINDIKNNIQLCQLELLGLI